MIFEHSKDLKEEGNFVVIIRGRILGLFLLLCLLKNLF